MRHRVARRGSGDERGRNPSAGGVDHLSRRRGPLELIRRGAFLVLQSSRKQVHGLSSQTLVAVAHPCCAAESAVPRRRNPSSRLTCGIQSNTARVCR